MGACFGRRTYSSSNNDKSNRYIFDSSSSNNNNNNNNNNNGFNHNHQLPSHQQQQLLQQLKSNQQQQKLNGHLSTQRMNSMNGVGSNSFNYNTNTNTNNGIQPQLPLSPPPQSPLGQEKVEVANYIALFDYDKATKDDMTIRKNDPLYVTDKSHQDWWLAKNLRTFETGYVPYNYITAINNLERKEWFFPNTTRREAERLLEDLENTVGMFLIRESEQDKGNGWSLSILDHNDSRDRHTKHYKIRKMDNGGCYISPRKTFASLDELVMYYSKNANGLCRQLTKPCPKISTFVGFKDVWEEDRENIELLEKLGAGNFGEVFKGLWRKKFIVAVKTLKFDSNAGKDALVEEQRLRQFLSESDIMKKLRHDKLVKLWCVCTKGQPIYIITEFMVNGCLLMYLRDKEGRYLRFKDIIDMAAQIASGMKYLEGCKCVHRDLAARNILVGERNTVKIADFGFAQMLNENQELVLAPDESTKFPVKWTAPEIFAPDPITKVRIYTIKSDVWSFGILLYELITLGANPYPSMSHAEVITKVRDENYRMQRPEGMCTESYYAMMRKCWDEDPNKRPTFDALFHFFNDYFINTEPSYKDPGY